MKFNKLAKIVYLAGALSLSGCSLNQSPKPYVKLPQTITISPDTNICFDIVDESRERDIVSCEAYLIEKRTGIETKLYLSASAIDLELSGVALAHWEVTDQYNQIPRGDCTFILEMRDKKGKRGEYKLPVVIKEENKK